MSTVTIHEEVPGVATSAASFNSTLTSWNNGTAAGAIDQDNVLEEGLSRKNFANNTVEVNRVGAGFFYESPTPGGAFLPSAAYGAGVNAVAMNGGVDPVIIGPITVNTGDDLTIRCVAVVTSTTTVAGGTHTKMALQWSHDGATGWSTVTHSRGYLSVDNVAMRLQYSVAMPHTAGAGTFYYRLVVEDSPDGNVTIRNCVLFANTLAV